MSRDAVFRLGRREELAALAVAQHGAIAYRQLLDLGFTRHEVQRIVRDGWLHRVHHGVYAVGRRSLGRKGRWMGAVLACGSGALLSHRSAAALRGVRHSAQTRIEVTVPAERGRQLQGVRAYLCRRLQPPDCDEHEGIPCTSMALTLLDLAAVLDRRGLTRACDEAEVQGVFDLHDIEELLERSRGRRGAAAMRAVLRDHAIGTTVTRSELEERALALFASHGIPRPEVNVRIVCRPGVAHEVDFLWRPDRLVLETDGGRFHSTARAIERDRRKEAELVMAGHRVLRATWTQVACEPRTVARMVAAARAA